MNKDSGTIILIFVTIGVIFLNVTSLFEFLDKGYIDRPLDNVLYFIGLIQLIIVWGIRFYKHKTK